MAESSPYLIGGSAAVPDASPLGASGKGRPNLYATPNSAGGIVPTGAKGKANQTGVPTTQKRVSVISNAGSSPPRYQLPIQGSPAQSSPSPVASKSKSSRRESGSKSSKSDRRPSESGGVSLGQSPERSLQTALLDDDKHQLSPGQYRF